MHLYKSKFFITFIFEYFSKKSDFMVFSEVSSYSIYDGAGPFNDQLFKAVFLV